MRATISWLGLGGAMLLAGRSHAQEPEPLPPAEPLPPVERLTSWEAPADCIAIEQLRQRVAQQMPADVDSVRSVSGRATASEEGWNVTLTVYDADEKLGKRVLDLKGDDCREHDETLSLVVALLVEYGPPPPQDEPEPQPEPEPEEPEPPPEPKPEREPAEPLPPPSAVAVAPRPLVDLRAGAGLRALGGWAPSLAWGPTLLAGARIARDWSAELQGDVYLPSVDTAELGTLRTWGGRLHLRGCALPRWGSWGLALCPGIGWIGLDASARDVRDAGSALLSSFEVAADAGVTWALSEALGVWLDVTGILPVRRGEFVLEGGGESLQLHETRGFLVSSSVGLTLTL